MNKLIKFSFIFIAVLGIALFGLNNANAQAVCPSGYICTPIPPQPAGCPVGYTCVVVDNGTVSSPIVSERLSPSSPVSRIIAPSTNSPVLLGIYEVKSRGISSTLKNLNFDILVSNGKLASDIFSEINVDGNSFTAVKTNMSVGLNKILTRDTYIQIPIYGRFKAGVQDGTRLYTRIVADQNNIIAYDTNDKQLPVEGTTTVSSVITVMASSTVVVSDASSSISPVDNGSSAPNTGSFSFEFSLINTTGKDVYLDKNGNKAFGIAVSPDTSYTFGLPYANPQSVAGDTSSLYIIPAGTSRKFNIYGSIKDTNGIRTNRYIAIKRITLTDSTGVSVISTITSGLEKLSTPLLFVDNNINGSTYSINSFVPTLTTAVLNSFKFILGLSR